MHDLLVLLTEKPGHRHQAEGVARVIARALPARIAMLETRYRWWALPPLRARIAAGSLADPASWLWRIYGIDAAALARPDAIVASGRPSALAGVLLAQHFGVPFVYSGGEISAAESRRTDLILVNKPIDPPIANRAFAPVPNLVDPDRLPAPRPLRSEADLRGASVALLLGGSSNVVRFGRADWADVATLVEALHVRYGVRWLVTTSRRTGSAATGRFRSLAARGHIATFVDWRDAGSGSTDALFAADAIVVTRDSVSMVAEAIAARRPVAMIRPRRTWEPRPTPGLQLDIGNELGQPKPFEPGATGPEVLVRAILAARPIDFDARDLVAKALQPIIERLARARRA